MRLHRVVGAALHVPRGRGVLVAAIDQGPVHEGLPAMRGWALGAGIFPCHFPACFSLKKKHRNPFSNPLRHISVEHCGVFWPCTVVWSGRWSLDSVGRRVAPIISRGRTCGHNPWQHKARDAMKRCSEKGKVHFDMGSATE